MTDFNSWPLSLLIVTFIVVALIIGWFGIKMTKTARDLAQSTGLGEAVMGALFIGASTSLSGITTSITAASAGYAELAVSNGLGGGLLLKPHFLLWLILLISVQTLNMQLHQLKIFL